MTTEATSRAQREKAILNYLIDVSPDTFDEGSFGNWDWQKVELSADACRIHFSNEAGSDVLTIAVAEQGTTNEHGTVSSAFSEAVIAAVFDWEGANSNG